MVNGKKYIGQHKGKANDKYFGSGTTILKALKKYGKENFKKEILEFCATREEADQRERYWIQYYNAVEDDNFYNSQEGGQGGDGWRACQRYFKEHPEEAQKMYHENGIKIQKWMDEHPEIRERVVKLFVKGSAEWREQHPEEVKEIMKKVNLAKEKWQKEHPEEHQKQVREWIKSGSDANSQKVICLTTGEVFESQCAAARHYNLAQPNIGKCLKGERKSCGRHPVTGEKLTWKLFDETIDRY